MPPNNSIKYQCSRYEIRYTSQVNRFIYYFRNGNRYLVEYRPVMEATYFSDGSTPTSKQCIWDEIIEDAEREDGYWMGALIREDLTLDENEWYKTKTRKDMTTLLVSLNS